MDGSREGWADPHRIFIGYDPRETLAYNVCIKSLVAHKSHAISVQPVNMRMLGGQYKRPTSRRNGVLWDDLSNAPMATEFSISRFWVPLLAGEQGWALFCDGDFMFRSDVSELFALADRRFALQVVQHMHLPTEHKKMDNQLQTRYPRKNWSSLMLFNLQHRALGVLRDLEVLNAATGAMLHSFMWLTDHEIGPLPIEWNWLAGVTPERYTPKAVHFTLGTPDMPGYESYPYADEWRAHAGT